ncbi:hypothetical protein F5I97DRAFT_1930469 [Phlebopus sp. FC_14]|nr:hypothetical protein F5I97DRAFT_1930469 [Phlebopus sp. FC_14]
MLIDASAVLNTIGAVFPPHLNSQTSLWIESPSATDVPTSLLPSSTPLAPSQSYQPAAGSSFATTSSNPGIPSTTPSAAYPADAGSRYIQYQSFSGADPITSTSSPLLNQPLTMSTILDPNTGTSSRPPLMPVSGAPTSSVTSMSTFGADSLTTDMTPSTTLSSTFLLPSVSSGSWTSASSSTFMITPIDTSTTAPTTRTSSIPSMSPSSEWSYIGSSSPPTASTSSFSISASRASTSSPQSITTHATASSPFLVPTTVLTTFTLVKSVPTSSSYPSTVTVTSVIPGLGGTMTYLPTSSGVLSTVSAGNAVQT